MLLTAMFHLIIDFLDIGNFFNQVCLKLLKISLYSLLLNVSASEPFLERLANESILAELSFDIRNPGSANKNAFSSTVISFDHLLELETTPSQGLGYRDVTTAVKNDIMWLIASIGLSPFWNTGQLDWSLVGKFRLCNKTVKTDMVKRDVEIETVGEGVVDLISGLSLIGIEHEGDQHW
ncbi:hypothetical protein Tco_0598997 [Tanacetum coccineum]